MSTHYTHYDLTYFTINCLAVLGVVIPKLPWVRFSTRTARTLLHFSLANPAVGVLQFHRMRVGLFSSPDE